MNQSKTEAKAFGRYIRMSPNKVRRVLNQIRGKDYKEALMLLEFMPYRALDLYGKLFIQLQQMRRII